jgi:hypothetical protein
MLWVTECGERRSASVITFVGKTYKHGYLW